MGVKGHFRVEPRLIHVLGMEYKSTEDAIKELVANAWDADAANVDIIIPEEVLVTQPPVIRDDGHGMTRRQLEEQYLRIAYDRRSGGASQTPHGRTVRGHRGIGKFAGLMAAETMVVRSISRGSCSKLSLSRSLIEEGWDDLQKVELDIESFPADEGDGTVIELHDLRPEFRLPSDSKLGRVLLREFGRRDDFAISIGGVHLSHAVLEVQDKIVEVEVPSAGPVTGTMWISDSSKPLPDPGFIIRVSGRAIGSPTFFGLDADAEVPRSLLNRVSGEIHADFLLDEVTASYDAFVENSSKYLAVVENMRTWLKVELLGRRDQEAGRAPDDFVESYAEAIEKLPVPRRELARQALMRVFTKFYDDPQEKKKIVAELVLNAFEVDEYWVLVRRIDETPKEDVFRLAEILQEWGLSDIAEIVHQARIRLRAVDAFDELIRDPNTLELSGVHRALERNAWLISDEYQVAKSNRTLRNIVEDMLNKKYTGDRAKDRPDIFLVGMSNHYLLVELKKPTEPPIGRDEITQAEKYRDQLREHIPNGNINIAVIGGLVRGDLRREEYAYRQIIPTTFREIALGARCRLEWLIKNLEDETADGKANESEMGSSPAAVAP